MPSEPLAAGMHGQTVPRSASSSASAGLSVEVATTGIRWHGEEKATNPAGALEMQCWPLTWQEQSRQHAQGSCSPCTYLHHPA